MRSIFITQIKALRQVRFVRRYRVYKIRMNLKSITFNAVIRLKSDFMSFKLIYNKHISRFYGINLIIYKKVFSATKTQQNFTAFMRVNICIRVIFFGIITTARLCFGCKALSIRAFIKNNIHKKTSIYISFFNYSRKLNKLQSNLFIFNQKSSFTCIF